MRRLRHKQQKLSNHLLKAAVLGVEFLSESFSEAFLQLFGEGGTFFIFLHICPKCICCKLGLSCLTTRWVSPFVCFSGTDPNRYRSCNFARNACRFKLRRRLPLGAHWDPPELLFFPQLKGGVESQLVKNSSLVRCSSAFAVRQGRGMEKLEGPAMRCDFWLRSASESIPALPSRQDSFGALLLLKGVKTCLAFNYS